MSKASLPLRPKCDQKGHDTSSKDGLKRVRNNLENFTHYFRMQTAATALPNRHRAVHARTQGALHISAFIHAKALSLNLQQLRCLKN